MKLSANLYRNISIASTNSEISRPYLEVKRFTVMFANEVYRGGQEQELPGPEDKTTGEVLSAVKLDILSGSVTILSLRFPQLPDSAQSPDVNNEMLICNLQLQPAIKKKNPRSHLFYKHTHPKGILVDAIAKKR